MAAATYTTDLVLLNGGESTTGWTEPTGSTQGGTPVAETDYFIQQTGCIDKTFNATGVGGLGYLNGTAVTIPTDGAFFAWIYFGCPNAVGTKASGGMQLLVGNSVATYNRYYMRGSDDYTYGGWTNECVDPAVATVDLAYGTPTSTRQYFGYACNVVNAVAKGNPLAIDAPRYGRGTLQCIGGDLANGYATFTSAAAMNDANDATNGYNRWGLLSYQNGGYLHKGHLLMGTAITAVDFRDSNKNITISNTFKVSSNFNLYEVRNISSRVDWTGISIIALGTTSRGNFVATDNADINKDSCMFTDMGTFVYQSNSTILGTTYRRCGQITAGGAIITNCLITNSYAAIALACGTSIAGVSYTDFVSTGTGHAIELTGGTSHTLTGITFTGYAASNGSTGNEAVYFNIPSGNVTVYAASTFSYRTAGATITIIAGSVTAIVTVTDELGSPISGAAVALYAKDATGDLPYQDTVTIINSGTTSTVTHTAHGMLTNDKVLIQGASIDANNGVFTITYISANSYSYTMGSSPGSSPTGTIKATWTALFGQTDGNGQISMSRVFSVNQPVSGWARKSTSSPYYKTGPVAGVIDSGLGANLSALLLSDE